jgi:hypothetical protein
MSYREGTRAVCPRCGKLGYVEVRNVNGRIYHYFVHRWMEGWRRRVHKCYLGAQNYRYVEKFNPLGLAGLTDRERFTRYLRELLKMLTPQQIEWLKKEVSEFVQQSEGG